MSAIQESDSQPTLTRVFEGLAEPRRQAVLATVLGGESALTERTLADRLSGADEEGFAGDAETVLATLRHVDLPKLAALDLVAWDRTAETVAPGEHPLQEEQRFRDLLAAGGDRWAVATTVHGDERCRAAVEALAAADGTVTRSELAHTLAQDEVNEGGATAGEDLAVTLHHVLLPKLAAVDLLEYDPGEGTVVPADDLDVPLLATPDGRN